MSKNSKQIRSRTETRGNSKAGGRKPVEISLLAPYEVNRLVETRIRRSFRS